MLIFYLLFKYRAHIIRQKEKHTPEMKCTISFIDYLCNTFRSHVDTERCGYVV